MPSADYIIRPIKNSVICDGPCYIPTDWSKVKRVAACGFQRPNDPDYNVTQRCRKLMSKMCGASMRIDYSRKATDTANQVKDLCDRAKAAKGLSAGDVWGYLRAGIWHGTLEDFDQCSSHQAIILSAVSADSEVNVDTDYQHIQRYVKHKKAERQRIADAHCDGDLDAAKQVYTRITFGGLPKGPKGMISDAQLNGFRAEVSFFRDKVVAHNPSFHDTIKRRVNALNAKDIKASGLSKEDALKIGIGCKKWEDSLMSLFCRNKEALLAEAVTRWCIERDVIRNRTFDNSKDGLMLAREHVAEYLKHNDDQIDDTQDLMDKFREVGLEATGYDVRWERKCMEAKHDAFWQMVEEHNEAMKAHAPAGGKHDPFDKDVCRSLPTTQQRLEYFDRHFAWVDQQHQAVHMAAVKRTTVTKDGTTTTTDYDLLFSSEAQLKVTFGNIESGECDAMGRPIPLVVLWLKWEERRGYHDIECVPYAACYNPSLAAVHSPNIFNCFAGYPERVWDGARDDEFTHGEMHALIRPFLLVVAHLVGCTGYDEMGRFPPYDEMSASDRDLLDSFLMLVGVRVAHPEWTREPYAILVKSVQGVGKNSVFDVISRLVGPQHSKCSANIEDFLGKHAEGLLNKLAICLNEADIGSTSQYTNKTKAIISEEKGTANIKNKRPIDFLIRALVICFSNEACPIKLDVLNRERRWLVFHSNTLPARKWNEAVWRKIHQAFNDAKMLRALRQFLTTRDYQAFDFRASKARNTLCPAYQKLAQYFVPGEVRYMQHIVEHQQYATSFRDNTGEADGNSDPKPFWEHPKWNEPVEMAGSDLFEGSKYFYKAQHIQGFDAEKSTTAFNNKLEKIGCMTKTVGARKKVSWRFVPRELYAHMVASSWIEVDLVDPACRAALEDGPDETEEGEADIDPDELF